MPLSQISRIDVIDGASIIARRDNHRQMSVRTNIRGRDQGSFVADAQRRLDAALTLPDGYTSSGVDSSRIWPAPDDGSPSFCR